METLTSVGRRRVTSLLDNLLRWALCLFLVITVVHHIGAQDMTAADCSRWSIKGLRLGMPLSEVKERHPKAKHGRNWFRRDDKGREWHFWAESRMKGLYTYVLPEQDEPDARIISIVTLIDVSEASPAAAVDSLVERWGPPKERDVLVSTVRYFNAFGAPKGELDWKATAWEDPLCDILATALDQPRRAAMLGTKFDTLMLSIDSLTALVEVREFERAKARETTRP